MLFPLQTGLDNNWAEFVIEKANQSDKDKPLSDNVYRYLVERIYRYGVTDSLIKDLNEGFRYERAVCRVGQPIILGNGKTLSLESWLRGEKPIVRNGIIYKSVAEKGLKHWLQHRCEISLEGGKDDYQVSFRLPQIPAVLDETVVHGRYKYTSLIVACCMHEFDRLRRCQSEDCSRYYLGTKRAKWCSDTCGSRERLRKKRKEDRERQML